MFTRPALLATCLMNQPYFCRVNPYGAGTRYAVLRIRLYLALALPWRKALRRRR